MALKSRVPRTSVTVGRPAHVPSPIVLDDPGKIRRLLAKALNERGSALRVKLGSVILSLRVLDAEFRGRAIRLEWQSAFSRDEAANLASPPAGALCTWLVLAGARGALGFRSAVMESGRGYARIENPTRVAYLQKREELRLRVPGGYELFARIGGQAPMRIFDLSASGISVVVPAERATAEALARFGQLAQLAQLERNAQTIAFRLHGREVTARVRRVVGRTETRRRPLRRLQFKFIDLPDVEQDAIRLFVVDHLVSLDIDSEV